MFSTDSVLLVCGYILYNYQETVHRLLYIFLDVVLGYKLYIIVVEKALIRSYATRIKKDMYCISYLIRGQSEIPFGLAINRRAFMFVEEPSGWDVSFKIWLFSSKKYYQQFTDEDLVEGFKPSLHLEEHTAIDVAPVKQIQVYTREGNYENIQYMSLKLDVSSLEPRGQQGSVVDAIRRVYDRKGRATVFVSGRPGTGKSGLGYLLAKELNGCFCHSFNPTDPGDTASNLIGKVKYQDQDKPLVIILEEANTMIRLIHKGEVVRNQKVPTAVYDKTTWSNFLDDMVFYKYVVLVLTSNESKAALDALDPAYLRRGRVDAVFTMEEEILAD